MVPDLFSHVHVVEVEHNVFLELPLMPARSPGRRLVLKQHFIADRAWLGIQLPRWGVALVEVLLAVWRFKQLRLVESSVVTPSMPPLGTDQESLVSFTDLVLANRCQAGDVLSGALCEVAL